ncbi:MAG: ABC transporter substrate-binding protein [Halopseudomonas sp.]|uniref:heme/hemin ABC transporter substrate-binding protein n=1 Tax=Halopseudomonas sp. TaxID=2901191 RepID=UPI00300106A2
MLSFCLLLSCAALAEPLRLVSAGASVTALVQELELQPLLVGVDSTSMPTVGDTLPNIGYQRQLSAEGILSLRPDVLLGSEEMGPPQVLAQLREAGVEVIELSARADLPTLYANIRQIGSRFAQSAGAEQLISRIEQQVLALPGIPAQRPRALFLLSHSAGSLLVAGADTAGDSLIQLGGMYNPLAVQFGQYRSLSAEGLLQLRPHWLITTTQSLDTAGGKQGLLALQPALEATPAAQSNQVIGIEGALLVGGFSPHIVDTLGQLRRAAASPGAVAH